jgi:hypothetical protein
MRTIAPGLTIVYDEQDFKEFVNLSEIKQLVFEPIEYPSLMVYCRTVFPNGKEAYLCYYMSHFQIEHAGQIMREFIK